LSQKGFTQNSQLKTQNAGYASCKENKILVTTGITGYWSWCIRTSEIS